MEWARKPEKNALSNGGGQGAPRLKGYATVHRRRIVDLRGGFRRALATGDMRSGMCCETWGEGRVSGADDFDAEARRQRRSRGYAARQARQWKFGENAYGEESMIWGEVSGELLPRTTSVEECAGKPGASGRGSDWRRGRKRL